MSGFRLALLLAATCLATGCASDPSDETDVAVQSPFRGEAVVPWGFQPAPEGWLSSPPTGNPYYPRPGYYPGPGPGSYSSPGPVGYPNAGPVSNGYFAAPSSTSGIICQRPHEYRTMPMHGEEATLGLRGC